MKRFFKIIAITIGLVIAVVIAVAVALPLFFNPNDYKDDIAGLVAEKTGRELSIEGDLDLSLFPWLGLEAGTVALGNAPGFGEQPFARIEGLAVRIKLMPLLGKRIEADTVTLRGLSLNLARNKEGRGNWEDLSELGGADQAPAETTPGGPMPAVALAVGGVEISDARISWRDAMTATAYTVQGLSMRTGAVRLSEPVEVTAAFDLEGGKPVISGHVDIDTKIAYDLDTQRFTLSPTRLKTGLRGLAPAADHIRMELNSRIDADLGRRRIRADDLKLTLSASPRDQAGMAIDLSIAAAAEFALDDQRLELDIERLTTNLKGPAIPGGSLKGELSAKALADLPKETLSLPNLAVRTLGIDLRGALQAGGILTNPTFRGELEAKAFDPRKVLAALGQPVPATTDPKVLRSASLSTSFKGSTEQLAVEKLDLRLDDSTLTGRVDVKDLAQPELGFVMNLDGMDLDRYLPPAGQGKKPPPATPATASAKAVELPLETLRALNLDGRLRVGKLKVANLKMRNLNFGVKAKDGLIRMTPAQADLYQGRYTGKLQLDARGRNARLSVDERLTGVRFGSLLKDAGAKDPGALAGTVGAVSLKAELSGDPASGDYLASGARLQADLKGKSLPGGKLKALLEGDIALNLKKEVASVTGLRFSAPGAKVSGELMVKRFPAAPELSGSLAVNSNPRALMTSLGRDMPKTADRRVFKRLDLKTDLSGGKDHVKLKSLQVSLDDAKARGDFSIENFAAPKVRFDLTVNAINADRYLPPPTKIKPKAVAKGKPKAVTAPGAGTKATLPIEALRGLDVDGRVRIGKLGIANLKMSKLDFGLKAKDGLIRMTPARVNLYKGRYAGKLSLDARGKQARITLDESLTGVHFGNLLKDLVGKDPGALTGASGAIVVKVRVTADPAAQTYATEGLKLSADLTGKSLPGGKLRAMLNGDIAVDLGAQSLAVKNFRLDGLGVEAGGNVTVSHFGDKPAITGALQALANPRLLLANLGQPAPKTSDPKVLTDAVIQTTLSGSLNRIKLQSLSLKLDDTVLEGDLEIAGLPDPVLRFNLAGNSIDIDRYLPPPVEKKPSPAATPGAATATDLPLPLLRKLEADGRFRFEHMKAGNLNLRDIKLTLKGHDGLIRLKPISAKLYKGSYSGNISLDARGKQPKLAFDERITGVRMGPMLQDLRGSDPPITGQADLTMKVKATGTDLLAARRTLNGDIAVEFRDGEIMGINAARYLCSLPGELDKSSLKKSLTSLLMKQIDREVADYEAEKTDTTAFSDLRGTFRIVNGIAHNKDLQANSPLLRADGAGSIDLVSEKVDYTIKPALVSSCTGQGGKQSKELSGVVVPVHITGKFADLKYSPDLGGIATAWGDKEPATPAQPVKEASQPQQPAKKPKDALKDELMKGIFRGIFK